MHIGKDLVAAAATPLVLGILAEGESYGYAILQRVERALRRRARVERRHALPAAAPARAARARGVGVARLAVRPAPQALPPERRRAALCSPSSAGSGRRSASALREGVDAGIRRTRDSSPARPGHEHGRAGLGAGGADRRVARIPAPPARGGGASDVDELEGHLRDQIDELEAAGLSDGRGVPRRDQADRQPRRAVARVSPASTPTGSGSSS